MSRDYERFNDEENARGYRFDLEGRGAARNITIVPDLMPARSISKSTVKLLIDGKPWNSAVFPEFSITQNT